MEIIEICRIGYQSVLKVLNIYAIKIYIILGENQFEARKKYVVIY